MKFLPVRRAIVSITTESSTSLKSSWTSSPGPGGASGRPGSAGCATVPPATRRPRASSTPAPTIRILIRSDLRCIRSPGQRLALAEVDVAARPVLALDAEPDVTTLGQLLEELRGALGPAHRLAIDLCDGVPVLEARLLEQAAWLDRAHLHSDHLPALVLRQDAGLGEEGRGVRGEVLDLAAVDREAVLGEALEVGPRLRARAPRRHGRDRGRGLAVALEGQLLPPAPVLEHDP